MQEQEGKTSRQKITNRGKETRNSGLNRTDRRWQSRRCHEHEKVTGRDFKRPGTHGGPQLRWPGTTGCFAIGSDALVRADSPSPPAGPVPASVAGEVPRRW